MMPSTHSIPSPRTPERRRHVDVKPGWGRTREDDEAGFGRLEASRGQLPLKAMRIQAHVVELIAHATVSQTFVNTFDEPIEATYTFPLPARGAVRRFTMVLRSRTVEGVLEERGKARQVYEQAIASGHRAAIAEQERPEVFTLRVGNIMPGEEATVRLMVAMPLPYEDGEVTFRFPLVVAPRYVPGRPLEGESVGDGTASDTDAAPDASRVTPPVLLKGYPNPVQLDVSVQIDGGTRTLSNLRSSLHNAVQWPDGDRRAILKLMPAGEQLDRDLVLRWQLGSVQEEATSSLTLCPDETGSEGTLMLTVLPPTQREEQIRPRDVALVLDCSGSMSGWKMVAARRAVAALIDTLGEQDRFNVYAFETTFKTTPGSQGAMLPATWLNRSRALAFVRGLEAEGGTEMAKPLMAAAQRLAGGTLERDTSLVLITDGQVANERQIVQNLNAKLRQTRVYTIGIDHAVNAGFLQQLARIGGGACELVESEARLDEVMQRLHRMIDTPVLTELDITLDGAELLPSTLVPARSPDLFAGSPVTFMARYRNTQGTVRARLRGCEVDGGRWTERVAGTQVDHPGLTAIWARGAIHEMEDQHDTAQQGWGSGRRPPHAWARDAIETSLRFSVLSRFTAFVAVDRHETLDVDGSPHTVVQPVANPHNAQIHVSNDTTEAGVATRTQCLGISRLQSTEHTGQRLYWDASETNTPTPVAAPRAAGTASAHLINMAPRGPKGTVPPSPARMAAPAFGASAAPQPEYRHLSAPTRSSRLISPVFIVALIAMGLMALAGLAVLLWLVFFA